MMLFSLPAGALADQMSKRTVILLTKFLELILLGAATISIFLAPTALFLPFALLGLMGAQAALFGPAKYGIIPEILPKERLSQGNGALEMWTMLAIIAGTGLGPLLLAADGGGKDGSLTWLGAPFSVRFSPLSALPPPFSFNPFQPLVKRNRVSLLP